MSDGYLARIVGIQQFLPGFVDIAVFLFGTTFYKKVQQKI